MSQTKKKSVENIKNHCLVDPFLLINAFYDCESTESFFLTEAFDYYGLKLLTTNNSWYNAIAQVKRWGVLAVDLDRLQNCFLDHIEICQTPLGTMDTPIENFLKDALFLKQAVGLEVILTTERNYYTGCDLPGILVREIKDYLIADL